MEHDWSQLNRLQLGRYAEYFFKMRFVLLGLDVYTAEVDDRGIDFVVRQEPDRYWDIQIKSCRNFNYVFVYKDKFQIRENLILGLALFHEKRDPDLFLIPSTRWMQPGGIFADRDYEGKASKPDYGLNLSRKALPELEQFRFERTANSIFRLAEFSGVANAD